MLEKRVFVSFFQMSIGSPVKQVSLRPCPPSTCTCQQNFEPGRSPLLRWALVIPNGKDVVMIRSGKHIGSPETPAVHDEEGMTHPSDSTAVGPGLRFSIWRSGVPCPFGPILLASLCSSACISVAQSLLFPALSKPDAAQDLATTVRCAQQTGLQPDDGKQPSWAFYTNVLVRFPPSRIASQHTGHKRADKGPSTESRGHRGCVPECWPLPRDVVCGANRTVLRRIPPFLMDDDPGRKGTVAKEQ